MAFTTRWRTEFKDIQGLLWRIDIQENVAQGAITELKAAGSPLNFEFNSDSDDWNDPVRTSKAVFNVFSTTDFQLTSLYSDEDFHYKVIIYKGAAGTSIFWQGFIVTSEYSEPYDCVPYPVTITAIDGLNYLKNIKYEDTSGDPIVAYTGRKLESQIIIDILAKINIPTLAGDIIFTEYVNIYEESMASDVDDSPMDQLTIDVDIFQGMYCYEVLQELLKKYNAVIRQINGLVSIYRPMELLQAIVSGRSFTGATAKSANSGLVPEQLINRTGVASNLHQFPGSALMIKPAVNIITLNQDYGYKQNWIKNGQLAGSSWDGADFQYWTQSHALGATPVGQELHLENERDGASFAASRIIIHFRSLTQSFGEHAVSSATDVFTFEFEYLHMNYSGENIPFNVYTYVNIKSDNADKWLYGITEEDFGWLCGWSDTNKDIVLSDPIPRSSMDWKKFVGKFTGLPTSGSYTITLFSSYALHTSSVKTEFRNIQLYATSDAITSSGYQKFSLKNLFPHHSHLDTFTDIAEKVGTQYILSNSLLGKELVLDFLLGDVTDTEIDNVVEQFAGALTTLVGGVTAYTSDWNTRGGAESTKLLEIIGGEVGNQYSRPKQLIQMMIKEISSTDVVFSMIGNIQDALNQISAVNRKFIFNAGGFDVKNRIWNCDLIELIEELTSAVVVPPLSPTNFSFGRTGFQNSNTPQGGCKWSELAGDIYRFSKVGIGIIPTAMNHIKGNLSQPLTGTVATTITSADIVGTDTLFLTELEVGDSILIESEIFTVLTITSDTALTLDSAYAGESDSGLPVYCDPDLFKIDNGNSVNKVRVTKSGYLLSEKKPILFTANASPAITDYQTKWAAIFGPYPFARLFWIDENGDWIPWMQEPKYAVTAGLLQSITWNLGFEATGFIILQ